MHGQCIPSKKKKGQKYTTNKKQKAEYKTIMDIWLIWLFLKVHLKYIWMVNLLICHDYNMGHFSANKCVCGELRQGTFLPNMPCSWLTSVVSHFEPAAALNQEWTTGDALQAHLLKGLSSNNNDKKTIKIQ